MKKLIPRIPLFCLGLFTIPILLVGCGAFSDTPLADNKTAELSENYYFDGIVFKPNTMWQKVGDALIKDDMLGFTLTKGDSVLFNRPKGDLFAKGNLLETQKAYKDFHFRVDVNITPKTKSGIYFLGRYRINIADMYKAKKIRPTGMGGLAHRYDEERERNVRYDGAIPKANPSKPPGQWQTLEIDFKAPRFDKDGFKTEYAQFISVKLNGVSIHKKQVATGPSQDAQYLNETSQGPIFLVGDSAPVAFRNLVIEVKDFSHIPAAKPLKAGTEIPLGENTGKPMFNLVKHGKELFQDKGCKECHSLDKNSKAVKSGPNLFGVFSENPKVIRVYDSAEQHITNIKADDDYLMQSLRQSALHLAVRNNVDNSTKQFLPIMPSYNAEAISNSDITAIASYLKTLNKNEDRGPAFIWQEAPDKPYVLTEDLSAELVSNKPRLVRVNIGTEVSGRAYHVGLPNARNYSFDPRTLAVELIWSGRFLSLKNEKKNRADKASEIGEGAVKWDATTYTHLFQPLLSTGKAVDFSFKEPTETTKESLIAGLNDTKEFAKHLAEIDAGFIGVNTEQGEIPWFNYRVENNNVSAQINITDNNQIKANFKIKTASALRLSLADTSLINIQVSHGKVTDKVWHLPKSVNQLVTFSATVKKAPKFDDLNDKVVKQSNEKQPLVWSDASSKSTYLPAGYRLENALAPNDKFGRQVLFEPLGIAFTEQGSAYVSTRTSGVWKITANNWQQFAEGIFDSLGVVVDNENTIVVGEKSGLTRLSDKDDDGWADTRINLSDSFSFNANYHEYLHGPIKTSDNEYLYTLNLSHGLSGSYTGGGTMGTSGGYRGWAMKVDANGNTIPYANGMRSPAGLAIDAKGKIYYTDNQGDFQGTSKLHVVKPNAYYGHPASLVDVPGKTPTSPDIQWEEMKGKRDLPVGLLPHSRAMNSPGSPVWDTTAGGFGPYEGQMFIGDQTKSNIFRVHIETVNGVEQSALLPFMAVTASGAMRLTFSPLDNSLWVGQTGRGWWSKGGNLNALQRIVYNGETLPQSIYSVEAQSDGFKVNFSKAISKSDRDTFERLIITSWYYIENFNYGSEEKDMRVEKTAIKDWNKDGKSFRVTIENFKVDENRPAEQTSRVYEIDVSKTVLGKHLSEFHSKAWYTLNSIPKR
ncbi:family 16 glycoside hydrolase [Paraglaciecola sp. L3A3]|uniref:family 16 glycoside hydrolase n=1 Tax=Paraglaciecola sp. L3A3 TaxID=2686358 RepID=UPI00131A9D07|nr:family 16 glycoside hydrolase [Paraglaciecola sp. L3A3]